MGAEELREKGKRAASANERVWTEAGLGKAMIGARDGAERTQWTRQNAK